MVKKVVTHLDSDKESSLICITGVVLKNNELELAWIVIIFLYMFKGIFPDCLKISSVFTVFKNIGEMYVTKSYIPVCLLSFASKVLEKIETVLLTPLENSGFFSDFQYGLRSSRSFADLLIIKSDRSPRVFNRS